MLECPYEHLFSSIVEMGPSSNKYAENSSRRKRKRNELAQLFRRQHSQQNQNQQQETTSTGCQITMSILFDNNGPSRSIRSSPNFDRGSEYQLSAMHSSPAILYISNALLNWMTIYRILTLCLLIGILGPSSVIGVDPKFDPSTRMRLVLVPADAQVGSVIYRLRATDEEFDYPLTFEFVGDASASTVKIESLPCTKYNSVCQANVLLQRRLEPGRYYDFQVSVKDTKGGMSTQLCSITATNFTTPHDLIFPHKPGIIMIPEVSICFISLINIKCFL